MPGCILIVDTAPGSSVSKGRKLIVMEAMKMELILAAPFDGVVEVVEGDVGDQVAEGMLLARITLRAMIPNDP
jgi:3-methylcrotonyl-CoA carboxylase alpha subunit